MNLFSHRWIIIVIGLVLIVLLGVASYIGYQYFFGKPAKVEIHPDAKFIPDEIIVKFKEGVTPNDPELSAKLKQIGMVDNEQLDKSGTGELQYYWKLYLKPGTDVRKVHDLLYEEFDEVELSQPDYEAGIFAIPNDSRYSEMWSLQKIQAEKAWDISKGSTSVKVAVIDSGIQSNHPDLPSIVSGGNFYGSSGSEDEHGHGTHVAGTIGAVGNNTTGVTGINWNVQLAAYKVFGASGKGSSNIPGAVKQAALDGARVINMSLGNDIRSTGPVPCKNFPVLQAAINDALALGTVIVVAAGNNAVDAKDVYPASCEGVITVGSTTRDDTRSGFSNFGSRVDIAAPGGWGPGAPTSQNILSTYKNSSYGAMAGTSMASPHVAGVAALLLAQNPNMTPDQVKKCLIDGGDPISTDKPIGNVRLNAYGALNGCKQVTEDSQPSVPTATPPSDPQVTLSGYTIQGIVYLDENNNRELDEGESGFQGATLNLIGTATRSIISGADGKFTFTSLSPGEYRLDQLYNNITMNVYTFSLLNAVKVFTVDIPVPGDPNKEDDAGSPGGVIYPSPTPSPTLRPIPYYDCKEVTRRSPNNKTLHLKYLECTKSGEYIPKPQPT